MPAHRQVDPTRFFPRAWFRGVPVSAAHPLRQAIDWLHLDSVYQETAGRKGKALAWYTTWASATFAAACFVA